MSKSGIFERIGYPLIGFSSIMFYELVAENLGVGNNDDVLDVGTGTGYSALRFASQAKSVKAVDISKETVDFLRAAIDKKNLSFEFFYICASSFPIGFEKGFSKIYSADVLEHVEDPQAFFRSITRLLRDRGMAVVTFPNSRSHGRNFFNSIEDLKQVLGVTKLDSIRVRFVNNSKIFSFISGAFYFLPLSIFKKLRGGKKVNENANEFNETWCFQRRKSRRFYDPFINLYFEVLMILAKTAPLFYYSDSPSSIAEKRIVILLSKKQKAAEAL